jgi:hypothetical protein
MLDVEAKAKPETIAPDREIAWSPDPVAGATPRRRRRLLPVLLTVLVAAAAVVLGQAMRNAYMAAGGSSSCPSPTTNSCIRAIC